MMFLQKLCAMHLFAMLDDIMNFNVKNFARKECYADIINNVLFMQKTFISTMNVVVFL